MSGCFCATALRCRSYRCRLLLRDWSYQISLYPCNCWKCTPNQWLSKIHPRVWQKSLVWIPCGVVISCWSYMKFENCCFRLNHPSHFVNVSVMCAVATCYWSLCLLYCSDLWELFIGCGHVGTSLLVIILSLSRPLIFPGSQKSHICYLNSWPETCDFTYWFMLSVFLPVGNAGIWKCWVEFKFELSFTFQVQSLKIIL